MAREKRAAYAAEAYWGRPVPSFGDPDASVLIVGLAPGAHGSNRTGRMFTGDRSGVSLFRALHRAGFANQPDGSTADDGLCLSRAYITASVRCAPPANRPTAAERDNCRPYLEEELDIFRSAGVVVALGAFAFDEVLRILQRRVRPSPVPVRSSRTASRLISGAEPCSAATIRASRIRSRAGSLSRCSTPSGRGRSSLPLSSEHRDG